MKQDGRHSDRRSVVPIRIFGNLSGWPSGCFLGVSVQKATTTEQPVVSKAIPGVRLAVLRYLCGPWSGRHRPGSAPTTSSDCNCFRYGGRKRRIGETSAVGCVRHRRRRIASEWFAPRIRNLQGARYRVREPQPRRVRPAPGHNGVGTAVNQPAPNSSPGPSETTKIAARDEFAEARGSSSAACSAAAQVVEPRFPRTSAINGNRAGATPAFFASNATSRGFG